MLQHFSSIDKKFIAQLIANTVNSEIVFNPMLQIVETTKEFVFGNYQDSQKYKFCKLTLVDGENHIIHCRLSNHLSNEYNKFKKGMIVRMDRFTPLRYRVNDDTQLLSALFVSKFNVVSHDYLSEEIDKYTLFLNVKYFNIDSESKIPVVSLLQIKNDANNTLNYGFTHKPICNHTFTICSK